MAAASREAVYWRPRRRHKHEERRGGGEGGGGSGGGGNVKGGVSGNCGLRFPLRIADLTLFLFAVQIKTAKEKQ